MFISKIKYEDIVEENKKLQEELALLKNSSESQSNHTQKFLNNLYKDLLCAVEQHELVNGQHHSLGDLVSKIKDKFDVVGNLSQSSNNHSLTLVERGNSLLASADDMVKTSNEGRVLVNNVENLINELGQQLEDTSIKITHLSKRSKEIENIVKVIKEIAEQTNLFALNASIEAARAGEQGKGFSVVAAEVRKLAENTAESTNHISQLTQAIQQEINQSLQSTNNSTKLIQNGVNESSTTTAKIGYIITIIESVQTEVRNVIQTIDEQNTYSENILDEIHQTKTIFDDAQSLILQHIDDAAIVDNQLENGLIQLREMSKI